MQPECLAWLISPLEGGVAFFRVHSWDYFEGQPKKKQQLRPTNMPFQFFPAGHVMVLGKTTKSKANLEMFPPHNTILMDSQKTSQSGLSALSALPFALLDGRGPS